MENLIYVVDDEKDIRELLAVNFKKYGFKSKEFPDGKTFFKALEKSLPDLIVLDIMLPGQDGIEILKALKNDKKYSQIPVIMLTAKIEETDKIIGLELGADDYITKPFSVKELIARIKVILKRYQSEEKKEKQKIIKAGKITIDTDSFQVFVDGKEVSLTSTEYKILLILISNKGKVCSRSFLLDQLWGDEKIVTDRTIDVHIKHLRDKIKDAGDVIKNIRGFGYKFIK